MPATHATVGRRERHDLLFLGGLALLKILIHLPVLGRYGYHHDELYFLACGRHLALGYVDHAPLVPWIARLADTLFGASLYGLRISSLLAGAAAVFLTGLLARRLGGGRPAQLIACLAMLLAPMYLRVNNMLHLPSFEPLYWTACAYLVARIVDEDDPRLWLWVGLVAGVGLLNKHSMLLWGLGLLLGMSLTNLRGHLRLPQFYLGGVIAGLVFLPNLLWQAANGWPTVEFLRHLSGSEWTHISPLLLLVGQVLYLGPGSAPVWIAGLVFLFSPAGARYRILGWIYLSVLALLLVTNSKIYYIGPAYPPLLAAGGVALEHWAGRAGRAWLWPAAVGVLAVFGIGLAPLSLPILSIDTTERYITTLTFGAFRNVYELTGDLRGMFGWRERTRIVADVYHRLPPEERERAVIFAGWYGPAGAIDYFGPEHGLPGAVSSHNSYHSWGLPDRPIDIAIAVDVPRERLDELFGEVTTAAEVELENVNPWDRQFRVFLCRHPKVDLHQIWPSLRRF